MCTPQARQFFFLPPQRHWNKRLPEVSRVHLPERDNCSFQLVYTLPVTRFYNPVSQCFSLVPPLSILHLYLLQLFSFFCPDQFPLLCLFRWCLLFCESIIFTACVHWVVVSFIEGWTMKHHCRSRYLQHQDRQTKLTHSWRSFTKSNT